MLDTRIKFLASLYTALLITAVIGLLLFGGFQFKSKPVKGQTIQAIMVDVSQLNVKQSSKKPKKASKPVKIKEAKKPKVTPAKKQAPKKVVKKQPKPIKKKPAIIPKKAKPKIDTKVLEKERKEQQERTRKKKALEKRKRENQKKLEKAKRDLEELANKTKKPTENKQPNTSTIKGKSEADKRNELLSLWINAVQTAVYQQWSQPASTKQYMQCSVKVRQIPGGAVVNVTIASPCNASEIVKKSIVDAIMKAEPLPYKGFEKVFDRNAIFTFKAQE